MSEINQIFPNYIPAVLKHQPSHGWSVEYYAKDLTGKLQRKVIRMNSLRKRFARTADFKAHCNLVVCNLNTKLAGGWTPFGETQNSRIYTPIETVLDEYIAEKSRELRPDTIINYRSFAKCLKEWIAEVCPNAQCYLFNKVLAVRFMDFVQNEKGLEGRSWNNRLKQARAFFGWAVSKCYAKENPFETMKTKREKPKKRIMIPPETRKRIASYWLTREPNYLVLCRLIFSALLRPREAWRLKVDHLQLADGYIAIPEDISKTHYSRSPGLPADLLNALRDMVAEATPDDYLFGTGYRPGKKQMAYSRFRKDWDIMRKELQIPEEMQLYSLRDTGINEMIRAGIDPLSVMQHADHHDLSITTRYANHADPNLVKTIAEKAPGF